MIIYFEMLIYRYKKKQGRFQIVPGGKAILKYEPNALMSINILFYLVAE